MSCLASRRVPRRIEPGVVHEVPEESTHSTRCSDAGSVTGTLVNASGDLPVSSSTRVLIGSEHCIYASRGNFMGTHSVKAVVGSVVGLALLGLTGGAMPAGAITFTYINAGPADSRVFGGFANDSSGYLTSDLVSHEMAVSRNDTSYGPLPPPLTPANFDAMCFASAELRATLSSPAGTGTRTVDAPLFGTFEAHGETLQASGSYSSNAYVYSGKTTSTSPEVWIVHVDPSAGETIGTPADVTVSALIDGYVDVLGGVGVSDAVWNVATTLNGTVMSGSANQSVIGTTNYTDSGSITFTVLLGGTFELLVDIDLSTSGSGAGGDSTSKVNQALVEVSAVIPPPFFAVNGAKLLMIDKYAISSKAKMVLLLKDLTPGSIAKGPSADPPELSGTVEIFPLSDPSNRAVYDLDTVGWTANKDKVAKYKNSSAGTGTLGARGVTIKPDKLLKVVAKNLGDGDAAAGDQDSNDIDLGALLPSDQLLAVIEIENETDMSSYRMCALFDTPSIKSIGGGLGVKVLSKTSSLPVSCPQ